MSARQDARRRRKRAAQGDGVEVETTCKCGHARTQHVFHRARCTVMVQGDTQQIPCGCVQFELPADTGLFATALDLDEQLELTRKELKRTRALLRVVIAEDITDRDELLGRALKNNERLRTGIQSIINGPTSSRAEVQAALLRLMDMDT